MNNLRNTFESGLQELRTMRDEIRVRLHLAGREARDRWEKYLEPYVEKIEAQVKDVTDGSMMDSVRDAIERAKAAFSEYRAQLVGDDQPAREPLRAVSGGLDTSAGEDTSESRPVASSGAAAQDMTSQGGSPTILTGAAGRTSDLRDDAPTLKFGRSPARDDTPGYSRTYGHIGSYHGQAQPRSPGQELRGQQQGMQATSTPGMQTDDIDSSFSQTFDDQSASQIDELDADVGDDDDTLTHGTRPDVAYGVDQGDLADSAVRGQQNGSPVASKRDRSAQRDSARSQKGSSNRRNH